MEQVLSMKEKVSGFLNARFADAIIKEDDFRGQQSFHIKPEFLTQVCEALLDSDELDVKYLADITSLDWLGHEEEKNGRFEVIYNLYSLTHKYRFFLKARLPGDDPRIQTLTDMWAGANWMEREVFDMMGVRFDGHPDMAKILTASDLEGHPLRKDFPRMWEQPTFSWNKDAPPEVIK